MHASSIQPEQVIHALYPGFGSALLEGNVLIILSSELPLGT